MVNNQYGRYCPFKAKESSLSNIVVNKHGILFHYICSTMRQAKAAKTTKSSFSLFRITSSSFAFTKMITKSKYVQTQMVDSSQPLSVRMLQENHF